MKKSLLTILAGASALAVGFHPAPAQAEVWKFGVLSDTQWITNDNTPVANDGKSPASLPAGIIKQIDGEFIAKGVKLVVAVGDTIDGATAGELQVRQLYTQDLYNAQIAFYPVRGNHESSLANSGRKFAALWPQIVNGGINNVDLSASVNISSIVSGWTNNSYDTSTTLSATLMTTLPPVARTGSTFTVGTNFSYPYSNGNDSNQQGTIGTVGGGLSYSFDYNNVRFVLLDQFNNYTSQPSGSTSASSIALQQTWLTGRLSDSNRPLQAFVFAHKNLLGGNHLFGNAVTSADPGDGSGTSYTGTNLNTLNTKNAVADKLISTLYDNNVHYYIGGHDHHHKHSLVYAPTSSTKWVEQIISASDSNKFYTPASPFSTNEKSIDEDLYEVGYYIYTVDGPRVTVDYYAVPANLPNPTSKEYFSQTPVLTGNWAKLLTIGYSLNGKTFSIAKGSSFTSVTDNTTYAIANSTALGESGFLTGGTTFSILNGTNGSTKKTKDGRDLTKVINTGWAPKDSNTISDIASIWGLGDLSSAQTDTVKVAVTFDPTGISDPSTVVLGTRDPKTGNWINAVDANIVGGTKQAYNSSDYTTTPTTLGSYGVDLVHGVAWAVVNGNTRDFAVINKPTAKLPWDLNQDGVVTTADLSALATAIRNKSTNLATYDLNNDGKIDAADTRWLSQHFTNPTGN